MKRSFAAAQDDTTETLNDLSVAGDSPDWHRRENVFHGSVIQVFNGFTDKAFEFFMAIRANNNKQFFEENRDWYIESVREPMRALAAELAPTIADMDERLETRPEKVVSRINRDVRFSNDKSPYRDYLWIAFRRPGEERKTTLGTYFDLSDRGASFGMGYYSENKPVMNALRRKLVQEPEAFLRVMQPAMVDFTLHPSEIARMAIPEDLPEELRPWYRLRGFYVERSIHDFDLLKSPELAEYLIDGYRQVGPLYQYIVNLPPEEES